MRAFCTVVSCSHLRFALALASSLQTSGNYEPLHVLVTDLYPGALPDAPPGVSFHSLIELAESIPTLMPYYFDAFELCNSLKPYFVSLLFSFGFTHVIYLDSDIFAVGHFQLVWQALKDCSLLLTPHQLKPPAMGLRHLNEKDVIDMGIYNGGFLAWSNNANSAKILKWMCQRFPVYGFNRRKEGMFVDQKILSLAPVYFPADVRIWREPRVNIAYWNAHERLVTMENGCFLLEGEPVVFFHLSGFRVSQPELPCAYLPQIDNVRILDIAPWFKSVISKYLHLCTSIRAPSVPKAYYYSFFNGFRLTSELRKILFAKGYLSFRDPAVCSATLLEYLRLAKRVLLSSFQR